jgi:hypothetical protein
MLSARASNRNSEIASILLGMPREPLGKVGSDVIDHLTNSRVGLQKSNDGIVTAIKAF